MKLKLLLIVVLLFPATSYLQTDDLFEAKLNQKVNSMEFPNTNISNLLRLLAKQNGLNIVLGPEVNGNISVSLRNVTVRDVLNSVLSSLGFNYVVSNNIIFVKSFERDVPAELTSKVFKLKYRDAYDLIVPVTSMLTKKGKVEVFQDVKTEKPDQLRSEILVVSDIAENVDKISAVINEVDVIQSQILIEVRLIETILGESQKLGFNWPKKFGAKLSGAVPQTSSSSEDGSTTTTTGLLGYTAFPITNESFELGILTVDELSVALDLLEEDSDSKLVSNPKIATLNKMKAKIRIGTTIPIAEVNRGAAGDIITYKDKDVDVVLEVTPRIQPDNKISLEVHPLIEEIVGYTGSGDYPQPITSVREVNTNVTVNSQETVIIGGMVKESKQEKISKVWLLGDIPLLGYLFQSKTLETQKTDLLIFITPKILE
jgi:type IV pilus assembly protein PilQ